MATSAYKLELEAPKRNVFVTQLNEREDDEDISAYPIVKESASKLIETGLNTLQKTLLLKKEVEVDRVSDELAAKRAEFRARMEKCAEKQIETQKKQQRMRDRVTKFEKFIKENEAKRRRAIQKYQSEVKLKEQKGREYELLQQQLDEFRIRHTYLKNKLARYKIYETYLLRVLEILPAHYLEVTDSMITSLMMRHRTLSETNHSLMENLLFMTDEHEKKKQQLDEIQADHNKMKLSINSQLSLKQKEQESKQEQNQEKEQRFGSSKVDFRSQVSEFGQIVMAIDNLADKCVRRLDPSQEGMHLDAKLNVIKDFVVDTSDVVSMAAKMDDGTSSYAESKYTNTKKSKRT